MNDSKASNTYRPFAKLDSSSLHKAAQAGNEAQVRKILADGCDVNLENDDGHTALYVASMKSREGIVRILLQHKAIVNTTNNPLLVVKDVATAKLLIQANGNLHARDEYGNTPLHKAILIGNKELIDLYLSFGAKIHVTTATGHTALHTQSSSFLDEPWGSKLTQELIQRGASVNCKDYQGRSPLHLAAINYSLEKEETIRILIKAGSSLTDLDIQGFNPLHHFISQSRGCSEMDETLAIKFIDILLADEQSVNSVTAIGQTILHLSISDLPFQILQYLVKKGCRLDIKDSRGQCLLHYIVDREEEITDVLKYLLNMGLKVDDCDDWGQTALHLAIEKNKKKLAVALIDFGADVNVKDANGRQPIHIAAEHGWDSILDFLIERGANINSADSYMSSPFHFAAWNNKSSIAYTLIKAGCDVETRDSCGETAKEVAEFRSSLEFLQVFDEQYGETIQNQKKIVRHANRLLQLSEFEKLIDSNESLRDTGNLNEFLCSLISAPPTGVLYEEPEAVEIRRVVNNFALHAANALCKSDPKLKCTVFYAGSSFEGTKALYPDEFDYIVCFDELSEDIYPQHQKEDVRESFFLIPDKEDKKTNPPEVLEEGIDFEETITSVSDYTLIYLKEETKYPYPELTITESKMVPNHTMFQSFTQRVSNIVYNENFPKDHRLLIKDISNDPKIVLLWKGSKYKSLEINVDLVPAVRLPSWPNKSRISSILLGPDLQNLPCLAVPKMTSHHDENLWRCSLSLVETAIMRRCRPHIRNSYIVAKSLVASSICPLVSFGDYEDFKNHFRSCRDSMSSEEDFEMYEAVGDLFPSYIIKMAFLRVIEEKAARDGVQSVFEECLYVRDPLSQLTLQTDTAAKQTSEKCKDCDPEIVKSVFENCKEWLSGRFVPSFFNPRHNVLGSRLLEEDCDKLQYFIKYLVKLLNEN
uniref:Mab-21-like nucleotidyltransferase domain-containing protein n=2 Tax=Magallana gigas TaxID=29159 RepID=A0A8W8JIL3_MAGGI|nr:uncharacterized protein LOC105334528 [Crassostrea gigas]